MTCKLMNFPKLILSLLAALLMTACANYSAKYADKYRSDILKQCEEDAELLEMTVEECFDRLNIW